jgi:hypothetical protein
MFPHRTAFFDKHRDEIVSPEKAMKLDYDFIVENTGKPCSWDEKMECYNPETNLIPLASTGLEDSEGNEIFEGSITAPTEHDEDISSVIVFYRGKFQSVKSGPPFKGGTNVIPDRSHEIERGLILGHALTDPGLVPKSFDVEKYFGLEEPANAS